jgi:hypothetical protein
MARTAGWSFRFHSDFFHSQILTEFKNIFGGVMPDRIFDTPLYPRPQQEKISEPGRA